MSLGYAKLFESLWDGSLRGKSNPILVFANLLTHAGPGGIADVHFKKISDETGLSTERVREAIVYLEGEDPESRSPAEGGRRIVRLDEHRDWGWRIVNHPKYRCLGGGSGDDYREKERIRVANFRKRKREAPTPNPEGNGNGNVTGNVTVTLPSASASASASVQIQKERGVGKGIEPASTPPRTTSPFERFWGSYPKKLAKKDAEIDFKGTGAAEHIDRILQAIEVQTKSDAWVKEGGQFIPYPATWLRGGRWMDEQFTQVREEEFGTRRASRFRIQSTKGWIYWTRTDGGPRREQFGKGEDQERTYRCCVEAYNAWIGNPQLA